MRESIEERPPPLSVTPPAPVPDNAPMLSILLLVVLILLILGAFGGGMARPTYRTPGISIGTILLIILLLWVLGFLGSRPF